VPGGAEEAVVPAVVPVRPSAAEETYAEAVEIPVRPPSPAIALGGSGKIAEGEPLAIRPALARALAASYRLVVSRFPEVELANAIRYLVRYPYGCLEQTASSAFPLVYLRDLIERTGIEVPPREDGAGRAGDSSSEDRRRRLSEDIDRFVLAGIQRILDMQSPAGWCSMWPGSSCPWPWGSIYAAHFLIEARAAGYPVPAAELDALLEYVRARAAAEEEGSETDLLERAYGLYVLALAEKPDLGTLDDLAAAAIAARESAAARGSPGSPQPNAGLDCPSAVYLLAAASYRAGRADRAQALLEGAVPEPRDVRDTGGALLSPARETAFLLSALLDVDPKSALVDPLVERLRTYRADGRWGTTQENAFAILALGKYARLLARGPGGAAAEVRIGDAEPIAIRPDADDRASWTFEGGRPPEEIRVSVSGPGTLFYSWTEEGVPLEPPAEPVDSGIEVRRRYLDASGAPLDLANVRAGETVLVEISLRSDREARNVAVVDLLPAGLEVENPRLEGKSERVARLIQSARTGASKDEDAAALEPAATSHRDDRVVAFVDLPRGRRGILYHVCRAVTRGEFQVPPVRAEALYDPRIASVSGAGRMAIR
ncbi:MAG: alpha-2-macroglobulin family protein, partial [Planctomycetota bacterium]